MRIAAVQQAGLGLIELMISIAIGLFILAGVLQLYATSSQNSSMVDGASSIQEHVRFLFSYIESDIANAGYAGCLNFKVDTNRIKNISTATLNPSFIAGEFVTGTNDVSVNGKTFDQFIVRYAGSSKRVSVQQANSDNFVISQNASSQFSQGDVVLVGDCSGFGVFRVSNAPGASGVIEFKDGTYNSGTLDMSFSDENSITPAVTYLYGDTGAFKYYIDTSTAGLAASATCSADNTQYCALYRKSSASNTADELVEGVTSFEVEYGWRDAASGNLFFAHAGSVPSANWSSIDRIKIEATLSSRNKTPTNEGIDFIEKSYSRTFFFFNQIPGA